MVSDSSEGHVGEMGSHILASEDHVTDGDDRSRRKRRSSRSGRRAHYREGALRSDDFENALLLIAGSAEPKDAGDYVCQISDRVARDQVHTVEVLVPPSVRAAPDSRHVAARRGAAAALECRASGNPVPTVVWTKAMPFSCPVQTNLRVFQQNDSTVRLGEGPQLQLSRLERQHSGRYACTVDNGVGPPLVTEFTLQVLYPPEITVERSWVHTGEGFRAELLCTVLADPPAETKPGQNIHRERIRAQSLPSVKRGSHGGDGRTPRRGTDRTWAPQVTWYQNSFPLSASERMAMTARGNNHTLLIANVQPEDFGNYSCVADNSLGRARQHVEVSGRPGPARFTSPPLARAPHSYSLAFSVDSYPPLDELRLLYRQLAWRGDRGVVAVASPYTDTGFCPRSNGHIPRLEPSLNHDLRPDPPFHRLPSTQIPLSLSLFTPLTASSLIYLKTIESRRVTGARERRVHESSVSAICRLQINESFQQPGRWHDVVIPAPRPAGALTHRVTHELKPLEAGAVYEAIVQAKNRYGWNEVSDIFQFHTLGGAHSLHADELSPPFASAGRPARSALLLLAACALGAY
ncbi:Lachesin [Eumeta japonica]|uniref:Lachesin n=1 Tax=Eumeta variegata TaxID=151549 RepID=A0A4C1W5D7_EUMVA|nr:Lachesin [Eumeta japonica]